MYGRITKNVEEFKRIVRESHSRTEVLKKLGYKQAGGNHSYLESQIKRFGLDISHFVNNPKIWSKGKNSFTDSRVKRCQNRKDQSEIFKKDNFCQTNPVVIKILIESGMEYKCNICNIKKWNEKPLRLRLDHINGDRFDYRKENLRLICPNCDSQTDTFCRGMRKKTKKIHTPWWNFLSMDNTKTIVVKDKCNPTNYKTEKCILCGGPAARCAKLKICMKCWKIKSRRVERPSYEQLLKDISETNYSSTGKKYGVSDNAIRKWIRCYKKEINAGVAQLAEALDSKSSGRNTVAGSNPVSCTI